MAESALEKLNKRLSGGNSIQARDTGPKTSEPKREGKTVTIENPAEAFGAKTGGKEKDEKENAQKRRGRPPGTKNKRPRTRSGTTAKENKTVIEGVSATLFGIHFFLANAFEAKEFVLSQDESEKLALAIQRVSDQYGRVIDPKVEAWLGLAGIAGACYAPRIIAFNARKRREERNNRGPAGGSAPRRYPQEGPTMPPAPEPQPATKPEVKERANNSGAKTKGPETPSEVFGNINFDPENSTVQ